MFAELYFRAIVLTIIAGIALLLLGTAVVLYYRSCQVNLYQTLFVKEKELREYHEEFTTILYSISDGVITTDERSRVKRLNQTAAALTGWTEAEAQGKPLEEVYPIIQQGTRKVVENPAEKVLKTGTISGITNHTLLLSKDGREIPVADSGAPIRDRDGKVEGTVLVFRDITEQELAERELRESEEKYRILIEEASDGIFIADIHGNYLDVNPNGCAMLGYLRSEFLSLNMRDVLSPEDRAKTLMHLDVLHEGKFVVSERMMIRKDGTLLPVEFSGKIMVDGRIQEIVRDITERKLAEEALRASEKRYRRLFESAKDGILILNAETGKVVDVNPFLLHILGYSYKELCGQRIWDLGVFKDITASQEAFRLLQEKEYIRYNDLPLETRDGRSISVEFVSNVYLVDREKVIQCNIRDITESKTTEQLLQDTQRRESLGVLSSSIAHDFNNLLGAMMGNVSIAQSLLHAGHPAARNMEKVVKAMDRAAELTQQMLAYSGKGKFQIGIIDIGAIVQEHVSLFNVSLPKNVKLVTHLPATPAYVNGDPGQIEQIIMNLIINGGDAIGDKQGVVSVTLDVVSLSPDELRPFGRLTNMTLEEGSYALLEVTDNGIGMSSKTVTKIFDPFFTTKFTGRGLGLSAVLGIIKGHKGGITVASKEGAGTTFRVLLPVCSAPITSGTSIGAEHLPVSVETTTILVIDDEQDVATMAQELLETQRYTVIVELNPRRGIEFYQQHRSEIGLVLLDLTMPEMSGKEVMQALEAINPDVKIILSSGYSVDEVTRSIGAGKVSAFIQKPYRMESLLTLVRQVMQ